MHPRDRVPATPGVLFLSGNQRSGKTLVQLVLSSHPAVSVSPGSSAIQQMFYDLPRQRSLTRGERRRALELVDRDRKLRAWRVAPDEIRRRLSAPRLATVRDLVLELMRCFRDHTSPAATIVGNKKGFYCKGADIVLGVFPEARFVFLVRDGRGAVASMLDNQPEHDVVSAALMWRLKAQRIRAFERTWPESCLVVSYESLVADPEATCRELCRFLRIDFAPRMLTDYRTNDAVRHTTDRSHAATYGPITTEFVGRWRERLSAEEIEVVESIAGAELSAHGYPLVSRGMSPTRRLRGLAAAGRDQLRFLVTHLRRKHLVR